MPEAVGRIALPAEAGIVEQPGPVHAAVGVRIAERVRNPGRLALVDRPAGLPVPRGRPLYIGREVFAQLFPGGVRMTAQILADFEQWAELTERLVACAGAS